MIAATTRKAPESIRGRRGVERAVRVTQKALGYLRTAGTCSRERKRELERIVREQRRCAVGDVRNLVGKTVKRCNPNTGELEQLQVTRALARTWSEIVGAIYDLARKASTVAGDLQPIVPVTRALLSTVALTSSRTYSTWMPWLEAAGVILYHHGRSRHCTLVGLPELYRRNLPHTRAVVEGHLHAAHLRDEDRWWWAPMCRALLEYERAEGDARGELKTAVVEVQDARLEWEQNKTAAVNEKLCKAKAAELDLQRAKHLERQRQLQTERERGELEERERAAAAEIEAFARLDHEKRKEAIRLVQLRRKAAAAAREAELDRAVEDAAIAHAVALSASPPQSGNCARNPASSFGGLHKGSTTPAPSAPSLSGKAGAPTARKTSAPDGAGPVLDRLRRMAASVLVDAGPAAGKEWARVVDVCARLVPVREGQGTGGAA